MREKMVRRKGSPEYSEEGQRMPKQKRGEVVIRGEEGISKTEDWCFVCKDGGTLRLCDFPECGKSYHFGCVGKKKSFLKSQTDWQCDRHSCLHCGSSTEFTCYLCPNAVCFKCLRMREFIRIAGVHGFCQKCVNFALHVEGQEEKPNLEISPTKYKHLKEYYWIIKKKYGFTLDELQAANNGLKSEKKWTSAPTLGEANVNKNPGESQNEKLASSYISQNEKVTQKRELKSSHSSRNKKVMSKLIEVVSPVHENVRRIYLTRSVIEKLLKQPESFEARVKGTFVGIEVPQKVFSNRRVCQLVQLTGITKTSCDEGPMTIKLQTKNMPDDISVDMISDIDFSKNTCIDLSQKVKDGLFEMPTTEEFQRMTKDLSEDIADDFIARETRRLQLKMDQCNEKGWRGQFYGFSYQKHRLQLPSERLRLIKMFSEVVEELPNDGTTNEIMNEEQEIEGSKKSIFRTFTVAKNDKIASDPRPILKDCKKQNEGSPKSIACNLELTKDKSLDNKRKRGLTSDPVQEQVMKMVNEPVIRAPVSPTRESTGIRDDQVRGERYTNEEPIRVVDDCPKPVIRAPVSVTTKSTGIPDDQVRGKHYTNEELIRVVDDFIGQKSAETEILDPFGKVLEENEMFDVMRDELESNATESYEKIVMREHKRDALEAKMDDGRPSLKGTTQEDTGISAAKMESLEEKINCIAQNIKQIKEEQTLSAEGPIILSNPPILMDVLYNLLEPVARLACTKALEEIKAKYFPDLDLNQFPNYDTNAMEKVHPLLKGTVQSVIDTALAQQGTMEGKCNQRSLVLQPPSQAQEEQTMGGTGNQLILARQPLASQAQEEATMDLVTQPPFHAQEEPTMKGKGNQLNRAPQPPSQAQEEPAMKGKDNQLYLVPQPPELLKLEKNE